MKREPLRVLIVDDEQLARLSIRSLIEKEDDCTIIGEASNGLHAIDQLEKLKPDLIFLDIDMPKLDGISFLREHVLSATQVVLTTAYSEFAIDGFELEVTDYLLKPFTDERFKQALNRVRKKIEEENKSRLLDLIDEKYSKNSNSYPQRIAVKSIGKIQMISVEDIVYIQATGNYTELHSANKKYLHNETISQIEKVLDPHKFTRIHRSTIVKISEVKELINHQNGDYLIITKSGEKLKLSRTYKHQIKLITGQV